MFEIELFRFHFMESWSMKSNNGKRQEREREGERKKRARRG